MKNNLIAACLQLTSSSDIYKNLKETIDLSNKAIDKGAFLISTPEVTNIISLDRQKLKRSVFLEKDDPFLIEFTKIAKKKSVWILLGSIVIKDNKNKLYNRSYLINSKGNIQYLSPRDFLLDILRSLYGLDKVESREIVDTAIKIFDLESDGSLPIDWKELYKNQA